MYISVNQKIEVNGEMAKMYKPLAPDNLYSRRMSKKQDTAQLVPYLMENWIKTKVGFIRGTLFFCCIFLYNSS